MFSAHNNKEHLACWIRLASNVVVHCEYKHVQNYQNIHTIYTQACKVLYIYKWVLTTLNMIVKCLKLFISWCFGGERSACGHIMFSLHTAMEANALCTSFFTKPLCFILRQLCCHMWVNIPSLSFYFFIFLQCLCMQLKGSLEEWFHGEPF